MSDRDDAGISARRIRARELATWAHDYAAKNPEKLREAGGWLDREYSTAAVLERRRRVQDRDLSAGIPASAYQLCPSEDMAEETLQVVRLNSAIIDLRHNPPDLTSAALANPLPWAYRVVLLVCLGTDRDAGSYTAGITEIGQLAWVSDAACRCWASLDELLEGRDPILRMLEEARHLIGRADHKARSLANPLLQELHRRRPERIQHLFDVIIKLECATAYLLDSVENPDYAGAERHSEETLELGGIYLDWCDVATAAIKAVDDALGAAEETRPRLGEAWLAELRRCLRDFISLLHPMNVGVDGRALRQGRVHLPAVRERLAVVSAKRLYLMDVEAVTIESPPIAPPTTPPVLNGEAWTPPARPVSVPPPPAEKATFRSEGDFWRVDYKGVTKLLKHRKGMSDIATLLRQPDPVVPFQAVDLMGLAPVCVQPGLEADQLSDDPAIKDYVQELTDLNARRDAAAEANNEEQLAYLELEIQRVADHIRAVKGFGGRGKTFDADNPAEKARKAVGKRIDEAIDVLENPESGIPALAEHLEKFILTEGAAFAYRPGKAAPNWDIL